MLISVEHEMPAISTNGDPGIPPALFEELWGEFARDGWVREGRFGVSRNPSCVCPGAKKAGQALSTDTGPTIELAPSPAVTIADIERQISGLRAEAGKKLHARGVTLLGSGVNPLLGCSQHEYAQYRTPRKAYDYAVEFWGRWWDHRTILNIAAMQEVIDVSTAKAPLIVSVMHRLTGLMLFMLRNDPDYRGCFGQYLSVRPDAWRRQVARGRFAGDREKVTLPTRKASTWKDYLRLLWKSNPMFMLGTKNSGLIYVPCHPTFAEFISSVPEGGWEARSIETGESLRVKPDMDHVQSTDWSYMGFARLRLFWRSDANFADVVRACNSDDESEVADLVEKNMEKVLLENRSSASPPPGEEMASLALVVGLIENFDAVREFAHSKPYSFWLKVAADAETKPIDCEVESESVLSLAETVLSLARQGLRVRGMGEAGYLEPIDRRIRNAKSASEEMLDLYQKGGMDAVIAALRYSF